MHNLNQAQLLVCILLCSLSIASVELSHIATELFIHGHFWQLLSPGSLLGAEAAELALPQPCLGSHPLEGAFWARSGHHWLSVDAAVAVQVY